MSIHVEEKKYPKKFLYIIISLLLIFAIGITALFACNDVFNVKNSGSFVIKEGMTVKTAADELYNMGIIQFPIVFRMVSRLNGYDTQIKPGRVDVTEGMSYKEILNVFINPVPDVIKVVIPEGLEVKEIAERLSEVVSESEFYAALEKDYNYRFLEGLPDREPRLEGYLFPATYEFKKGISAEEVIDKMLSSFDEHFTDEYYKRAAELGMTVDQIVTLASIIERESASGEERPKVAGVFYNRLNQNMRLQSCATVQYILKERKPVLSTDDTKIQSPYNTYVNSGLPVGPIASPGEECIKAALYPESTDALYFVLGSDGKHVFSANYEDHLKAKNGGQ